MTQDNDALIRRWFEEVWNKGREDAIAEMFAEDGIIHGLADDSGQPVENATAFRVFHRKFREAFPDIQVVVEDTVAEGDKIAARCSVRGKHTGDSLGMAATQAQMEITGIVIARSKDGKLVECWNNFDFMTMYKQLGAI
jgi:steroid delta-isomerase-like uncharacterized protein